MPEALSARGRRTQSLGILIVGGLILVALVSAVLWLSVAAGTAAIFFCMGVSFFALLAVYAGKLIVDEERYMQARLEARDARYRQTLELLPEGVVILKGEDGVIEWVNTMAGVHLGITSEDVGSVFTDRLIASQPAFCAWLRSRDFSRHYALETAGGSVLLDAAVVAPDERHTIIVTHDVTERRRVDDMRRDFVANVSHELRTPLTVIAGFLDLADMDVPPELRKRHLALMRDQTARMKRLTDDLLMLSKLENRDERGTDQPELIDMSALIDDAVREGMAYSKMQHKFEVAHEPLSLLGHPEEIRSAVLNLITNAVRYTPRGGRIRVVWKRTGTGAVLTVADTGIGIPPEHLPRITERFYRVDKGRSRDTGGTGLGLASSSTSCGVREASSPSSRLRAKARSSCSGSPRRGSSRAAICRTDAASCDRSPFGRALAGAMG